MVRWASLLVAACLLCATVLPALADSTEDLASYSLDEEEEDAWDTEDDLDMDVMDVALQTVDMGRVAVGHLHDTKPCYEKSICRFNGKMNVAQKEHAENANAKTEKNKEKLHLSFRFEITSQCASTTHNFFQLKVTHYERENHAVPAGDVQAKALLEHAMFFDQSRHTGKVDKVYFSDHDIPFSKRIKQGLLDSVVKRIHHNALHHATKATADLDSGAEVTYNFEGEDASGPFTAHHRIRRDGADGSVILVEAKDYDVRSLKENQQKTKGVQTDGQSLDAKRTDSSQVKLGPGGHVKETKEQARMKIGTEKPLKHAPVMATASTGKSKFRTGTTVERIETVKLGSAQCRHEGVANVDIEARINTELKGSHSRPFRKQWTMAELETVGGYGERDPQEMAVEAKRMVHEGDFGIPNLAKLLTESNVGEVAAYARKRFADKKMSLRSMKMFLGALSAVRCEHAYKELLGAFASPHNPYGLRQQALVSLLHAQDEPAPPAYVVDMVSDVAHSKTDPMAWEATMLLGSLLQKHTDPEADGHITKFVDELQTINPNDGSMAKRAMVLLGALHNIGPKAAWASSRIGPFVHSPFRQVRMAATDALKRIGLNYQDRQSLRKSSAAIARHNARKMKAKRLASLKKESGPDDGFGGKITVSIDEDKELNVDTDVDAEDDDDVLVRHEDRTMQEDYENDETGLLDVDMNVPAPGGAVNANNHDSGNIAQEDKDRTEGGRLVEQEIPLSGNPNFGVVAHLNAGAEWANHEAAAFGNAGLSIRVLFFKMEVLNLGSDYRYHRITISKEGMTGVKKGRLSFTVTIIMIKVLEVIEKLGSIDVNMGGACPKDVWAAKNAQRRPDREFFMLLFFFGSIFPVGPLPLTLKVFVGGGIGYKLIGALYGDCTYEGRAKQSAVIGGLGPYARVTVVMEASINLGVASAGIEGELNIIRGDVPIYGIANPKMGCGRIDMELSALSGKVSAFIKILFKKFKAVVLKWKGPSLKFHMFYQCKTVKYDSFPPIERAKPKPKNVEEKPKPWWQLDAEKAQKEKLKNIGKVPRGPDGALVIREIRRRYERLEGLPVDPRFGTDENGWPFPVKTPITDLLPTPKQKKQPKSVSDAMAHELRERSKTERAAALDGVSNDGGAASTEAYEAQVAAARAIAKNAEHVAAVADRSLGFGSASGSGMSSLDGFQRYKMEKDLHDMTEAPLEMKDHLGFPRSDVTQGVPHEFHVHAKDSLDHWKPLQEPHAYGQFQSPQKRHNKQVVE